MKKILVLCMMLALVSSCVKAMRYTNEEIKGFDPKTQEFIRKGEIAPGMTFLEVRYAWGPPADVKVLQPNDKGQERIEWQYKGFASKSILRFTEGKVTEIITSSPGIAK